MTPTILKAESSADFLAAFYRMAGVNAPESCFIVKFEGNRSVGTARVDLLESLNNKDAAVEWISSVAEIAQAGSRVAIVLIAKDAISEYPLQSKAGIIATLLSLAIEYVGTTEILDVYVIGSDGWASVQGDADPQRHELDAIKESPLYVEESYPSIEEWRTSAAVEALEMSDALAKVRAATLA